jgi:hypothetical protein
LHYLLWPSIYSPIFFDPISGYSLDSSHKNILIFYRYFRNEIDKICNIEIQGQAPPPNLFKKILFSVVIDSLSRTATPERKNRTKFIEYLTKFSGWEDHDRISIVHLERELRRKDLIYTEIGQYTKRKLSDWMAGEIVEISREPKLAQMKRFWEMLPSEESENIEKLIKKLQHSNLFYEYRNHLIHEFRTPGYGMEIRDKDSAKPFYHNLEHINPDGHHNSWELVYPTAFFENITKTSLSNLKNYMQKENIDPHSYYSFGSYWIEKLNQ